MSVSAYLGTLNVEPGQDPIDTYMMRARAMSIDNYRAEFTAAAYITWAQRKFGMFNP